MLKKQTNKQKTNNKTKQKTNKKQKRKKKIKKKQEKKQIDKNKTLQFICFPIDLYLWKLLESDQFSQNVHEI